jgi:hypothetical protein
MKAIILVSLSELAKTKLCDIVGKKYNEIGIALKVVTGYEFDNNKTLFQNGYGDWFSFSVYKIKAPHGSINYKKFSKKLSGFNPPDYEAYEISVWDYKGTSSLGSKYFVARFDDYIPSSIITFIKNLSNEFTKGYINCSDCGKQVLTNDIAWEGGRKEVEAKEDYN